MIDLTSVLLIDIGCGDNKKQGFFGIDISNYPGVDYIQDLRFKKLPFNSSQLDQIFARHFLEHLTFEENLFLFNEAWRTLKIGGVFDIIVPHAMSYASFADLSHKSFWTEDTFGYFTPDNKYHYSWFYETKGEKVPIINRWEVLKNDTTPPYKYTVEGWVEIKSREIHAILKKLPLEEDKK